MLPLPFEGDTHPVSREVGPVALFCSSPFVEYLCSRKVGPCSSWFYLAPPLWTSLPPTSILTIAWDSLDWPNLHLVFLSWCQYPSQGVLFSGPILSTQFANRQSHPSTKSQDCPSVHVSVSTSEPLTHSPLPTCLPACPTTLPSATLHRQTQSPALKTEVQRK